MLTSIIAYPVETYDGDELIEVLYLASVRERNSFLKDHPECVKGALTAFLPEGRRLLRYR